ncbi:MAG: hypothetical protein V2I63_05665 [Pseudomonadales bacterium]|jgi:hypothetical protein|nr:hypothetical protein [Pseudomonadales bacterium]
MRFLIGIISGAAVVVVVALGAGVSGEALRSEAWALGRELSAAGMRWLAEPGSADARTPVGAAADQTAPRDRGTQRRAPALPEPAVPEPAVPDPAPPAPGAAPQERLAAALERAQDLPEAALAEDAAVRVAQADSPPRVSLPPETAVATVDLLSGADAPEALPGGTPDPSDPGARVERKGALQAVWTPFHSERSASGFAARLATSLDHPFEVVRRGPGRYEVAFAYREEAERRRLLEAVRTLTGAES